MGIISLLFGRLSPFTRVDPMSRQAIWYEAGSALGRDYVRTKWRKKLLELDERGVLYRVFPEKKPVSWDDTFRFAPVLLRLGLSPKHMHLRLDYNSRLNETLSDASCLVFATAEEMRLFRAEIDREMPPPVTPTPRAARVEALRIAAAGN